MALLSLFLAQFSGVLGQTPGCYSCIPHLNDIYWVAVSKPPCLHPGQPIFEWSTGMSCSQLHDVHSDQISVDESGLIYAKQKFCFYSTFVFINYSIECGEKRLTGRFKLGHPVFSKQRRFKRWLRRRNPDPTTIHFQQASYIKQLAESVPPGTLVETVNATHAADQPIYYSLAVPQDSRSQNIFTLDTISGEIRLAKPLDREILDKHVLKVTAYERLDPTVSSSATVIVDVLDVQDNSPVFEKDSYFADIREDAPIGTTVLSVFARDLDAGQNGEIVYSLGEGEGHELLSINTKSGVIQTAAFLDRETLPLIRLDVIATDRGDPPRLSTALIEIGITDVNDNAPMFEQEFYNITVMENVTLPTTVAYVRATDKDNGVNGKVHYSIVTTSSVPLTIDYSTGEVVLRERLSVRSSPIAVLVRAKDGAQPALSTMVTLLLYVIDINDHAPMFIASQKKIFLEENMAVGDEAGRVYAIDEDSGDNGVVRYSLNRSLDFYIDPESGVIRTATSLDRERTAEYELKVCANDLGSPSLFSCTQITVVVKDVNDNAPKFSQQEYNISLSEETPRGSQIITLKADDEVMLGSILLFVAAFFIDAEQKIVYRIEQIDKDVVSLIDLGEQGALLTVSGKLHSSDHIIKLEVSATDQAKDSDRGVNAHLTYSIDSDVFLVNNKTGLVTLKEPLDREMKSSYLVTVTVSDAAVPPLNSTMHLEIIVDDVNDNAPKFSKGNYTVSIPEDIPVGTSFTQVSAMDLDVGNNGIVDYFLNNSDSSFTYDLFRLDRTSGTLRVNSKLDREQHSIIELRVFARDRGKPLLTSTCLITIILTDVNDNAPIFDQSSYDLYIAENSPIGSTVGTIMASDPDEGENARIQFKIFGGTDAKLFGLETNDNQPEVVKILTRSEFDYEAKNTNFYLEVQATSGQLSSTVVVRVHVSDVNDNRPILNDFIVLINRFESETSITDIGMMPAFDPDQNATLEYYMEENQLITVEKFTGKLVLKSQWKRNIDTQIKTCVSGGFLHDVFSRLLRSTIYTVYRTFLGSEFTSPQSVSDGHICSKNLDGPNTVCSMCRFIHVYLTRDSLHEAATILLPRITLDDFWDPPLFNRFRQSLATLDTWEEQKIFVVGAQYVAGGVEVNVVVSDRGHIVKSWRVEDLLRSEIMRIERLSLIKVEVIRDESCAREPCPYYQRCRQTLKHVNAFEVYQTDSFVARTLKTLKTFVCECPPGFASECYLVFKQFSCSVDLPGQCDLRVDQCYSNPCRNNGTCHPLENGHRCECQPGWRGEDCTIALASLTCIPGYCRGNSICELVGQLMKCKHCGYDATDSDERCRLRSLGFTGKGLVNINKELTRLEWQLSFRVATIAREGVILFSGDQNSDFIEVSIQDRILRAEFSLGGKPKAVRLENERRNRINDGEWHTINVIYYERQLTLLLDDCDAFVALYAHGAAPCAAQVRIDLAAKCVDLSVPCFRFLDVYNGIYIGGRPSTSGKVQHGFNEMLFENRRVMLHVKFFVVVMSRDNVTLPTSDLSLAHYQSLTLTDEESFVIYRPEEVIVPFTLSFEFRSSRNDLQVVVAEFKRRSTFLKIEVSTVLF
ncbi:unnamed protein product [Angiostrongylus costaricensis]|uniref:Cadherin-23 n=1 Tax=Angiostrongylus costaricensis TaxID=334426 RepID=A0A158PE90_ANGCS|nr:unnamed protein product [Angiostrongylus costaricensis]